MRRPLSSSVHGRLCVACMLVAAILWSLAGLEEWIYEVACLVGAVVECHRYMRRRREEAGEPT